VEAIANAAAIPGIALLGHTADPDHNRCVITFAGSRTDVEHAAVAEVATALEHIDLTAHAGVHPRLGSADVVPFVPLAGATMREAVDIANSVGERIWRELRLPVFLYEAAARHPERRRLERVRRGSLPPDIGGPELHPTGGACIVGARHFLIAWNVNLASNDVAAAKKIARAIRESSGGFACVKALGLELRSRGIVQVSMNLTDFERSPIPVVYDAIRRHADELQVPIVEAELIGFLPQAAYDQVKGTGIPFTDFTEDRVIENRIAQILGKQ
jgi:glutamate formiminotransferase